MADGAITRVATGMVAAAERKAQLGQFLTRPAIARFMAGLFAAMTEDTCRLLDAGAGIGALSDAFLRRWLAGWLVGLSTGGGGCLGSR